MHKPCWKCLWAAATAAVVFASNCVLPAAEKAAAKSGIRIANDDLGVAISVGNRPVLHYRDVDVRKKPYVNQLFSPAGVEVLRDAPADHLHHHGLMYGVKVDGVNFWEEVGPNFGSQQGRTPRLVRRVLRTGLVQDLEWLPPGSAKPALIERRAVDVLLAADLGATLVEWQCRLETPAGQAVVELRRHSLPRPRPAVRAVDGPRRTFSLCRRRDSGPLPARRFRQAGHGHLAHSGPLVRYTAKADGRPVTVAMFDDPHNFSPSGRRCSR